MNKEIVNACVRNLSGSRFRSCLYVSDEIAEILDGNIGIQYDCRLLQSLKKEKVIDLFVCGGTVVYKEGKIEGNILYVTSDTVGGRRCAG